jgi:putative inorganic carbon (HCO3(-)) transporter
MLSKSRYKVRGLVSTTVLAAGVYWLLPQEQIARMQNMGDDVTSISRTTLWAHGRLMMSEYPVLGIGYKNWLPYHESHYGLRLLPHNIFIEAGAELGYTGLICFIALIIVTLVINYRTRRLLKQLAAAGDRFLFDMSHGLDAALMGYLACGFFVTVLYYPFFWINFAMTVSLYNAARNKVHQNSSANAKGFPRRAVGGPTALRGRAHNAIRVGRPA